jgi:hypothetical protein
MIVDLCGVETGDRDVRKQMIEQRSACFGKFVQNKCAACEFSEYSQQPGAGRRLQHTVGCGDGRRRACRQAKRDWC